MAAALPVAAMALQVGGQLYQGYAENKAQRRAARADEENARLALLQGEQDVGDIVREARFQQGNAAASIGTGLLFGGSIASVLADSALQADMDIQRVRDAALGEAKQLRAQAQDRRRAGKSALIGAGFSALSTAIEGASSFSQQRRGALQQGRENSVRLGGAVRRPMGTMAAGRQ